MLEKCPECGEDLKGNSIVVWKCNNCDKSFKGSSQFLQNLQRKKDDNPGKNLLKCNNCGSWLDDGKEDISVKCSSCGNMIKGNLRYFIGKSDFIKCPECRRSILCSVKYCPECGYDIRNIFNNNKEKRTTKKKYNSYTKNIFIIVFAFLFLVMGIYLYKINHKEIIHGVYWGMDVNQVKKKEKAYSNTYGDYNEKDNYYVLSNVDFYEESVTLMYIFEDDKLSSIWVKPTYDLYETAYRIAFNICKKNNMPVSFEDYTDESYAPRSILQWNTKGTTIKLIGDYKNKYSPIYYFSLEYYDGNDYGDDYKDKGVCCIGEKTLLPCRNNIIPWGEVKKSNGYCYKHGCYVIGCPNKFANVHDQESLCLKHHFLCE